MKQSRLNMGWAGVIMSFVLVLLATACNNSDNSGKNSTAENVMADSSKKLSMSDTSTMKAKTNPSTSAAKKIGKIMLGIAPANKSDKMEADKTGYYNYTETAPVYPGGQSSLENYISNNIEYPQDAIDNEIEGTVNVLFTIDEDGNVANVKTSGTKLGYGLEEAAVKVVNNMPKWTPGKVKGKNVKAWYTLPVTFKLENQIAGIQNICHFRLPIDNFSIEIYS